MDSKIKKSFQNSRFYRNYNNIENVILQFKKIKNEYKSSKNKYKIKLISIINTLDKNHIQSTFLKKFITNFYDKFGSINFEKECNGLYCNEINDDEHKLNSCRKILDEKLKIYHDIKKYVKWSGDINKDFIKSVKIGNIRNIDTLIKNGADIHTNNDYAIKYSSRNGYIEVVKYLVENGANIHADNDYAFRLSSNSGHIEVVKFLVGKGANIHVYNDNALRCSSYYGHIGVVKFLIENGANIHAEDDLALRWSSVNGYNEVVKYLVENGANIHAHNDYALRWSIQIGHIDIVKFLINSDLEYYSKNEIAKNIIIKHNLIEFYENFDIK